MKKLVCLIITLLLFSGCQTNISTTNEYQPYTLKWCLEQCSLEEEAIDRLNEALREDGCNYDIELVYIPISEKLYSEQVYEYEEIYGSLDIVSTGYQFSSNKGAVSDFIKSGYFIELKDISQYTVVPEKLWETVKTNGKVYTIPNLNSKSTGVTFYFNMDYISQEQVDAFDGDLTYLEKIVSGFSVTEEFLPIFFFMDYPSFTRSVPYTEMSGIFLDNVSHKAVNPYEYEPLIKYANNLNQIYKKGLFGDKINFSFYDYPNEKPPKDFAVMISSYLLDDEYLSELGYGNTKLITYTLPLYLEHNALYSMGVAAKSNQKEIALDFLKRLYSDAKYAKILLNEAPSNTAIAVGVPSSDVKEKYESAILSDFVDLEVTQEYINTKFEDLLTGCFDILCKSDDFDITLKEINAKLKTAGIDDFIDNVNKLLEENIS